MPSFAEINSADHASFTALLGHLFEHSPWVAAETWSKRPFRDAAHLHAELCATLAAAPHQKQVELIGAHPDLAGRLAQQNQLTQESKREQAAAGLTALSGAEMAEMRQLNATYREKFNFPFIICARLNNRDAILAAMRTRIRHEPAKEFAAALAEIEKIAWLRLQDALASHPV